MKNIHLRLGIFYDVTFIKDTVVPRNCAQELDVVTHNLIGGHDQIVLVKLLPQSITKRESINLTVE